MCVAESLALALLDWDADWEAETERPCIADIVTEDDVETAVSADADADATTPVEIVMV